MESYYDIDEDAIIRASVDNKDIQGFYVKDEQWVLNRKYTMEGMEKRGLSPRTADLNLIGPEILPVPEYLVIELGLDKNK